MHKEKTDFEHIKLDQKEQAIEVLAVGLAVLLLLGCFLKIMFF